MDWHFADLIFKCISFKENWYIFILILLKLVPEGPNGNMSLLVQALSWHLFGATPLSEPMVTRHCDTKQRHELQLIWRLRTADIIYGCPIFIQTAETWLHDSLVAPVMAAGPNALLTLYVLKFSEGRLTYIYILCHSLSHASETLDLAQNTLCELVR